MPDAHSKKSKRIAPHNPSAFYGADSGTTIPYSRSDTAPRPLFSAGFFVHSSAQMCRCDYRITPRDSNAIRELEGNLVQTVRWD